MASSALSYANQLKRNDNKGPCGGAQFFDTAAQINRKFSTLFTLFTNAKNVLVHTGAGVSTAAGIPDFRGPSGVWTVMSMHENDNNKRRKMTDGDCTVKNTTELSVEYGNSKLKAVEFAQAMPSETHLAVLALLRSGNIKSIITQNIDGLHAISGIAHSECSEVHGNVFVERCICCGRRFLRPYVSPTISFKPTGNHCGICIFPPCGILTDVVLDWFDRYEDHFEKRAVAYAEGADFHLTLGSSLHVEPACLYASSENYRQEGAPLVIVNYQKTRLDREADVVIHCDVNTICKRLLKRLNIPMPIFIRHVYMVGIHYSQQGVNKMLLRFPCIINIMVWDKNGAKDGLSHRCLNSTHGIHEFSFRGDFHISCKLWFDAEMTIDVRYLDKCEMRGFVWKLSLAAANGPLKNRKRTEITHSIESQYAMESITIQKLKLAYNASLIDKKDACRIVAILDTNSGDIPGFKPMDIAYPIPSLFARYSWLWQSSLACFDGLIDIKEEDSISSFTLVDNFETLPESMRLCIMSALDRRLGYVNKRQFVVDADALMGAMKDPRLVVDSIKNTQTLRMLCAEDHQFGEMVGGAPTECKICLPRRLRPMVHGRGMSKNTHSTLFMTLLNHSIVEILAGTVNSKHALRLVNLFKREFPQWVVTYLTDIFECR